MQAYDTPFLTEPLLLYLQIVGTHLPMFDQIAAGTYQPPLGTTHKAHQLIPLLTQPTQIIDCPIKITPEQHKKVEQRPKKSLHWAYWTSTLVTIKPEQSIH